MLSVSRFLAFGEASLQEKELESSEMQNTARTHRLKSPDKDDGEEKVQWKFKRASYMQQAN